MYPTERIAEYRRRKAEKQAAQAEQAAWTPPPFSPTAHAERQAALARQHGVDKVIARGGGTRTPRKSYVCPARMLARHPDADLRRLAQEQAREQHHAHGPCQGKCRTTLSMFAKNEQTARIAQGLKRQARINERGW